MSDTSRAFSNAFAVLVSAAIPSLAFGRAVFAVAFGLGFLALLASDLRRPAWRELVERARSPVGLAIVATLGCWTLSALGSDFRFRSLEAVWRSGLFVAAATMIHGGLRGRPELVRLAVISLVAMSCVAAAFAVLASTVLPELYWTLRLKGWIARPLQVELKAYSSVILFVLPLFALVFMDRRPALAGGTALSAMALLYLAYATSNRAAVAGLLGALMALILARAMRKRSAKVLLAGLGLLVGLTALVVYALYDSRAAAAHDALTKYLRNQDWLVPLWLIDFQRQEIWGHALALVRGAPWLGIGANTINFTPGADTPMPGNESLHIIPSHPHNWAIEILVEAGAVGLVALLVTLALVFLSLLRCYRRTGDGGALAAIVILAAYWTSGLFNFSYWSAWWQISFTLSVALALTWDAQGRHRSEAGSP